MDYKLRNLVVSESYHKPDYLVEDYLDELREYLLSLPYHDIKRECISGYNRFDRHDYISSLDFDMWVTEGDIVYCDFGQAYLNEAGYQHFGLVIKMFSYKAFVVPMSSNKTTISKAMNFENNHCDKKDHLYYIGQPEGLNKPSVLFLNDAKFINTARVISIKGHLNTESKEFCEIKALYHDLFQ